MFSSQMFTKNVALEVFVYSIFFFQKSDFTSKEARVFIVGREMSTFAFYPPAFWYILGIFYSGHKSHSTEEVCSRNSHP
jgi:hypothetical protein